MSLGAAIAFFTCSHLPRCCWWRSASRGSIRTTGGARRHRPGARRTCRGGDERGAGSDDRSAGRFGSDVLSVTIGIATFLFVATGAIIELQDDLNIIWKVEPPERYGVSEFVHTRLLSMTLIVSCQVQATSRARDVRHRDEREKVSQGPESGGDSSMPRPARSQTEIAALGTGGARVRGAVCRLRCCRGRLRRSAGRGGLARGKGSLSLRAFRHFRRPRPF